MIYVVGSMEELEMKDYFVFHTAFLDRSDAVAFCERQLNGEYDWVVLNGTPGAPWLDWDEIHRTRRIG